MAEEKEEQAQEKQAEAKKPIQKLTLDLEPKYAWLTDRIAYLTMHGSHAYGTEREDSDQDWRAIVVAPLRYAFGFVEEVFKVKAMSEPDLVFMEIRHFFKVAAAAAPNALEMLWTDLEHRLIVNSVGNCLLQNKRAFLSKQIGRTFLGNAKAMMKKAEPIAVPAAALDPSLGKKAGKIASKRAKAIEAHGYDTKALMHAVRLLREGAEALLEGDLKVRRPDAEELGMIRDGALTYEEGAELVKDLEEKLKSAETRSSLPATPDYAQLDAICQALVTHSCAFHIQMPVMGAWQSEPMVFSSGQLSDKPFSSEDEA